MQKNSKIFILAILICSILTMLLGIFIGKSLFTKEGKLSKPNQTVKEVMPTETAVDIFSSDVIKAIAEYNSISINEEQLYKNDIFKITNLNDYDLVFTAVKNVLEEHIDICDEKKNSPIKLEYLNSLLQNKNINKSITNDMLKTLVSKQENISMENAISFIDSLGFEYLLTVDGDNLKITKSCGGYMGMKFDDYVNKKISKVVADDEYFYIYERLAFGKYTREEKNGYFPVNYYKDFDKTAFVEYKSDDNSYEPNWNLYNTYKYTFKKANNNYLFEQIELVK